MAVVYAKAEELFQKMEELLKTFKPWTAIGFLDIETFKEKLVNIEDWDYNIKNIRVKRKELEKLNDSFKIECFNINVSYFKTSADDLL